tara:strand:- start:4300 stop:4512 length:213 start_codon:yes stop_codon:yes gene_type:complete
MLQMDIDDLEFNFHQPLKKMKYNNINEVGSLGSNFSSSTDENYIVQQLEKLENIAQNLLVKIQDLKYELL